MKNFKAKFLSGLLISIMLLSSMNVIAAVSDDTALDDGDDGGVKEADDSKKDDLKDDAGFADDQPKADDPPKSDDSKDETKSDDSPKTSDDKKSADDENKLTVTNYTGTYDGKYHNVTVKASKSGTTFEYSLDNKTWDKKAPKFKDVNGTQTVYIKAENGGDVVYAKGTVTIKPVKITLTAVSASKTYDGTPLESNGYSLAKGSFPSGEGFKKVVVSGSQTKVGSSKNKITDYVFKSNTKAQNYDVTLKAGTLTVEKAKAPVKKVVKNETKHNDTNKTNKTNKTSIPLQNTGVPVLILAFSMFVIATLVKRD